MKQAFALLILFFIRQSAAAQLPLAVSNIPDSLLQNANAVIRFDHTHFEIIGKNQSITKQQWAVTILNAKGAEDHAVFTTGYDKLTKVKNIEGEVFNNAGISIYKLKKSDIRDMNYQSLGNEVTDNRLKVADFSNLNIEYPYTVLFSFEEESSNMMFFPVWYPLSDENTALQTSTFSITAVNKDVYRFKGFNLENFGVKEIIENGQRKWEAKNIKAFETENFSEKWPGPYVLTGPIDFSIEGYEGHIESWVDIGYFYSQLNQNRDKLPANKIAELSALIKPGMSNLEKINTTYKYMQSHTRYQSIQLGIGGWQTMTAEQVAQTGYGDCKALTNYTIALLKTIGINAYPALIYAGAKRNTFESKFPRMSFNHVIACVPLAKDTVWLECTSQTDAMNYQGAFTGNRQALLVLPTGGKLVNTINYKATENLQIRKASIKLADDGNATAAVNTRYTGIQQDRKTCKVMAASNDEKKKWLTERIDVPSFELGDFEYQINNKEIPELNEKFEISVKKWGSITGKRMFFKPNLLSSFIDTPAPSENRKSSLYLDPNYYSFEDTDTLHYVLPKGWKTESLPKDELLEETFGQYTRILKRDGDNLLYIRKVKVLGGNYAIDTYQQWISFIKKVNKADQAKVVLLKEET